jgi:putative ABC transport system permease protein
MLQRYANRMRSLISQLRYTVRQLLKSPGFAVTAVLILGLGIGANRAIFSLINGVLLKPLPYPNADRLFHLYRTVKNSNTEPRCARLGLIRLQRCVNNK